MHETFCKENNKEWCILVNNKIYKKKEIVITIALSFKTAWTIMKKEYILTGKTCKISILGKLRKN